MIHAVHCNHSSFKTVNFRPGFNVILADRTEASGSKDSRNGLGKSTLIEIIHFCLGAKLQPSKGLGSRNLRGWAFSLELTLKNKLFKVTRSPDNQSEIIIEGDTTNWPIQPKEKEGQKIFNLKDWTTVLGNLMFGLSLPTNNEDKKFQPTFRSLISYFIRRGRDAFSTPFEHFRKQLEWDKQVNNAFLLGLAWEDARDLQLIKDRQKLLENFNKLKKDTESGVAIKIFGSLGELKALKIQIESQLRERKETLSNFRVALQYYELEHNANRFTVEIHEATNKNIVEQKLLEFYQSSLESENEPSSDNVAIIYENAGVELPDLVIRRLEEVEIFHRRVIENRREFLEAEIKRLKSAISSREHLIKEKTEERAFILEVLQTHGALEEYTMLQEMYLDTVADLNEISKRIEELKKFEEAKSSLKIEKERLLQRARRDREERSEQAGRAIDLFNYNSRFLYNTPGTLILDVGPNGFQFKVDIKRDGSEGIGNMKIFCYDLMLAQLWSEKDPSPHILIHDSTIFDGVDERQVALALQLADIESRRRGFQYICTFNSDMVPHSELPLDFNFDSFVRLTLTDESDEGGLLGIRF
ncbi:MAG: DUF2326 domain-containing protein [Rhizonema sp. PD37]|nr:DUF2326 domain-containing protein [Rhizonema sp. PD37]